MKRLTTTTKMMERRMARPAATPTPAGPPRRVVAVVAVDEGHEDGEDHRLEERVEDVERRQVEPEVVGVGPGREAEELGHDELGGQVAGEERGQVERDHRDQRRPDPGGHEVDDAVDAHDLERVDLVADAHGAELGGEAGAHLGGQGHAGDERGDLAGVGQAT